jgi:dTDP-4-amino-4,6-dideoxygalactose transaminase
MPIKFNVPYLAGNESLYLNEVLNSKKFCGDGLFTMKATQLLENYYAGSKVLLTTSCTHAIEMAAILVGIQAGDEVIMPSYTFVSTANPFILRGANIVFVDIDPNSMNIDENLIENAITVKTKAIVVVHYAGVSCNMDKIMDISKSKSIYVIEDAAQAITSKYNGKKLGTIGHFGCLSFHETKNIQCGEGGALIINRSEYNLRSEIIREKGTNRSSFLRGQVDKYTWRDVGSSYLPSELNAAFLLAQLEEMELIQNKRKELWFCYFENLKNIEDVSLPYLPGYATINYHMFYIKVKDINIRAELIDCLGALEISTVFHYIPLHSSEAGLKYTNFDGKDVFTTKESEKLLRLPLHNYLTIDEVLFVCRSIASFFNRES